MLPQQPDEGEEPPESALMELDIPEDILDLWTYQKR